MSDHPTSGAPGGKPLRIGVMGAGSVGMFFAARLSRVGATVTAVARPAHVDAVKRDGLAVDSSVDGPYTARFMGSTDAAALRECDVVLVSVKTVDTDATGDLLAPLLDRHALVVSLQNGVDNAWRLRDRMPHAVVPAVVYVSVEMTGPGRLRHNGGGRLIVGAPLAAATEHDDAERRLGRLQALLQDAGVPCPRSDDVRVDLWTKLATNCAYNAISALTGRRYGRLVVDPGVRAVMDLAADEIAALAGAEGVPVTRDMLGRAIETISQAMPQALSSTAQDLQAGRRTEIDDLNGFVVRRGAALGVPTPVNQTLRALVKFVEQARDA